VTGFRKKLTPLGQSATNPNLPSRADLLEQVARTGVGAGGTPPRGTEVLDTAAGACQTRESNWFDHWTSEARAHSASMGQIVTVTTTGSQRAVSRVIEEHALRPRPRHLDRRAVGERCHHTEYGGHRRQE
jgi:hypothetical protein